MPTPLWTAIHQGVLADRPAATSARQGYVYFASDVHGGMLYQCNGSTWVQIAAALDGSSYTLPVASTTTRGGVKPGRGLIVTADGTLLPHALGADQIASVAAGSVAGTLAQTRGGTGLDTSGVTDGQVLVGKSSDHTFGLAALVGGTGISITNGAHSISIAATGGGSTTLAGDTDVSLGSPADGQALLYASGDSLWHNRDAAVYGPTRWEPVGCTDGTILVTSDGAPVMALAANT